MSSAQAEDQFPDTPKFPSYYVTLLGVDFVSITDEQGNTNTQIDEKFALQVPNVGYTLIGDQAVFLSMPSSGAYTMTFRVGDSPITLEALKGLDNVTPTDAVRYRDVELPAGVTAMLRVTSAGIETLRYDSDGDTVFETVVAPTVSLSGGAAADVTPPTVTISGETQLTKVRVTINVQDSASGAKPPRYSLDGTNYQLYSGPFLVDPLQTRVVSAFSDDHAANRSATAYYDVPQLPSITAPPNVTIDTNSDATNCGATIGDDVLGNASAASNSGGTVVVSRTGLPADNFFSTGATSIVYTATDSNGLIAEATQIVTVTDKSPPTLTCPANVVAFLPWNSGSASMMVTYPDPGVSDNCPGAVTLNSSHASGSLFNLGTTNVHVTGTDAAGNAGSCDFSITVMYRFEGFFSPVGNLPILNSVNAGQAIPMKFSLNGPKGLDILSAIPSNPGSGVIPCDAAATEIELTETETAGNSSLAYEAGSDRYKYVWKTNSAWAGTCRQFVIQLKDGTIHRANFKFK